MMKDEDRIDTEVDKSGINEDLEPEFTIDAEEQPLIPEGIYTLGYEGYETGYYFYTPKINARFVILDKGEYYGTRLHRFYTVEKLTGPSGKNGRFKPGGWSSNFVREWIQLFGKPKRGDRLSLRRYKVGLFKAKVETVTKDGKRKPLPKDSYYSAISELISLERIEE